MAAMQTVMGTFRLNLFRSRIMRTDRRRNGKYRFIILVDIACQRKHIAIMNGIADHVWEIEEIAALFDRKAK